MKLTIVAGARPNFVKIAPIIRAIENARKKGSDIEYRLVHTGQHYDDSLSKIFFEQLQIPEPHDNFGAGSGTQAEQTGKIMVAFEADLVKHPTDLVVVVGDVNSTLACTIVAKKLNVRVAHVEAGIRSFDMEMPEEINRIVTDALADYFFTTTEIANGNLKSAGVAPDKIHFVGNTMIDSLFYNLERLRKPAIWDECKLEPKKYYVLTLHRPSNVDEFERFAQLMKTIDQDANAPVIFPVHPRTKRNFEKLEHRSNSIRATDPMSYLEFIYLLKNAKGVITDSGGVQEETTALDVPCITIRKNTERPETVTEGTNEMVGEGLSDLSAALNKLNRGEWKKGHLPKLWDGHTAERIVEILKELPSGTKFP